MHEGPRWQIQDQLGNQHFLTLQDLFHEEDSLVTEHPAAHCWKPTTKLLKLCYTGALVSVL